MSTAPLSDAPTNAVLTAAIKLTERGWRAVPVPAGGKRPVLPAWQELRLEPDELPGYFNPGDSIGILTGAASGGLMDVDLDCPEALRLAPVFLPRTAMRSGRVSSPDSHWWYITTQRFSYIIFKDVDDDATTLLELRGDGHQTLVPPSVHPEGEPYEWYGPLDPAVVDPDELE